MEIYTVVYVNQYEHPDLLGTYTSIEQADRAIQRCLSPNELIESRKEYLDHIEIHTNYYLYFIYFSSIDI